MTAAEWDRCDDPLELLRWASGRVGMRKLRLYAVAACRRVWDQVDDRGRRAVAAAEAWADREVPWPAVTAARRGTDAGFEEAYLSPDRGARRRAYLAWVCRSAAARTRAEVNRASWLVSELLAPDGTRPVRDPVQCALLRDIVGDPFRPPPPAGPWRTADVLGLARGIYADRAFDRLPLLGDALMDAGCADERVIAHCRGGGPHARGCWVVDWLLGKE